jgi:predicted negative regulator of RcsB-dependent stress response
VRAEARHNLKHDRFAETITGTAADTFSWASEHVRNLVIYIVVALVVIGGVLGGWYWYQNTQNKANEALGHAIEVYQRPLRPAGTPPMPGIESFSSPSERADAARREFGDIASKYSHTGAGHIAQYFLGLTFRDEGKYSEAETALKKSADSGDKDIEALSKYALAQLYQSTNRQADAIKTLKDLADHPTNSVTKFTAQADLADLYVDTHQPAEAAKIYNQIKSEDPKSPEAQFATQKLAALNSPK